MSKKLENGTTQVEAGEGVLTIRDILVGKEIAEFRASFESVGQQLEESNNHFNETIDALEKKLTSRIDDLTAATTKRFDELEKHLNEQIALINKRIQEVSDTDKKDLAGMLATLSQNLSKGRL